jgi:hypothetical protein
MPEKIFANGIIPGPMRRALDGISSVADKIRVTLTRYDITTLHEALTTDIRTLRQLVEELDAGLQVSMDLPNGQWVAPGGPKGMTIGSMPMKPKP